MRNFVSGNFLSRLRHQVAIWSQDSRGDDELLQLFLQNQDHGTFAAILSRHASVVWQACQKTLGDGPDAEDAFQATFIVLARRAGRIRKQTSLASWLYAVALRTARRQMAGAARRKRWERLAPERAAESTTETEAKELRQVVHEELANLPEKLRVPMVLCHIEGKTRTAVADVVGCSIQEVCRRLQRGETILRGRMARRGLAVTASTVAALLTPQTVSALPPLLLTRTSELVRQCLDGVASPTSPPVALAAQMSPPRYGLWASVALAGVVLVGAVVMAHRHTGTPTAPTEMAAAVPATEAPAPVAELSGRVLDAAGQGVGHAHVALFASPPPQVGDYVPPDTLLARVEADAKGNFQFDKAAMRPALGRPRKLVAWAEGKATMTINLATAVRECEVRLGTPREIRGRLVGPKVVFDVGPKDVGGRLAEGDAPVQGVRVEVLQVGSVRRRETDPEKPHDGKESLFWPAAVTSEADGSFVIRGLDPAQGLRLGLRGQLPFQILEISPAKALARTALNQGMVCHYPIPVKTEEVRDGAAVSFTYRFTPVERFFEGNVFGENDKKPIAGAAVVLLGAAPSGALAPLVELDRCVTDADGHFNMQPAHHEGMLHVMISPPADTSYLSWGGIFDWPAKTRVYERSFRLQTGVTLSGKVTEAGASVPVSGAQVQFVQDQGHGAQLVMNFLGGWKGNTVTGEHGEFRMTVPPGPGYVLVNGGEDGFTGESLDVGVLLGRNPNGQLLRGHRMLAVNIPQDSKVHHVDVTLQRGASVVGSVLGHDGSELVSGTILCPARFRWSGPESVMAPIPVSDGRFDIQGLDSRRVYPVAVFDAAQSSGCIADLPVGTDQPQRVRLTKCVEAETTCTDASGKPLPDLQLRLVLWIPRDRLSTDKVSASGAEPWMQAIVRSDKDGLLKLSSLLPGGDYSLHSLDRGAPLGERFHISADGTTKVPALRINVTGR